MDEIKISQKIKDNHLAYTLCVLGKVDFDNLGIGGSAVTPDILKTVVAIHIPVGILKKTNCGSETDPISKKSLELYQS